MSEFYRLPRWMLIAMVMLIAVSVIFQTRVISYNFRRLNIGWAINVENVMECVILMTLFIFAALLAQVQYALYGDFFITSDYYNARQIVFLSLAILGAITAVGTELIRPFFAIGGSSILLPMVEEIAGPIYPFLFLLGIVFFLIRSIHICMIRRHEINTQISTVSIKETIDTLPTGLLFYKDDGDILLCNGQMESLVRMMTGKALRNGINFQNILEKGELFDGCVQEELGGQKVFRLIDSSVWSFYTHNILIGHRNFILLTADDVTERWDAMTELNAQNQVLERRARELRNTIENLQAICEAEEIARSKGRVHDILGQRISLLLRALRDNYQPDKTLLTDFVHNLPDALRKDQSPSPAHRLEILKETFKGMDVVVDIRGDLPDDDEVADAFAKITVECVTNAVRHGYASRVLFHFFQNDCWRMTVTDNGIPPSGPIREGGGIDEMRRRIAKLNGTVELHAIPRFSIQIFVPKEDVQK